MLAENFAQSLNGFYRRRPFRPFEIELVSGDRIRIEHPEALAIRRRGLAVYVDLNGSYTLLDNESVCSLRDVTDEKLTKERK
jgi:hypothetical protein